MNNTAKIIAFEPPGHRYRESSTAQTHVGLPAKDEPTGFNKDNKLDFEELQKLLNQLNEVFLSSMNPDWDGEDAAPVSDATYYNATKLLSVLPVDLHMPEILPDNDGYLEFEWSKGSKNFSLYVTDTNLILFAGFYGKNDRLSGRFNFEEEFPIRVRHLAEDVYQQDAH